MMRSGKRGGGGAVKSKMFDNDKRHTKTMQMASRHRNPSDHRISQDKPRRYTEISKDASDFGAAECFLSYKAGGGGTINPVAGDK